MKNHIFRSDFPRYEMSRRNSSFQKFFKKLVKSINRLEMFAQTLMFTEENSFELTPHVTKFWVTIITIYRDHRGHDSINDFYQFLFGPKWSIILYMDTRNGNHEIMKKTLKKRPLKMRTKENLDHLGAGKVDHFVVQ